MQEPDEVVVIPVIKCNQVLITSRMSLLRMALKALFPATPFRNHRVRRIPGQKKHDHDRALSVSHPVDIPVNKTSYFNTTTLLHEGVRKSDPDGITRGTSTHYFPLATLHLVSMDKDISMRLDVLSWKLGEDAPTA